MESSEIYKNKLLSNLAKAKKEKVLAENRINSITLRLEDFEREFSKYQKKKNGKKPAKTAGNPAKVTAEKNEKVEENADKEKESWW